MRKDMFGHDEPCGMGCNRGSHTTAGFLTILAGILLLTQLLHSQEMTSSQNGSAGESHATQSLVRFAFGDTIRISYIHMVSENYGWATAPDTDEVDHVLYTADGALSWVDVTPPLSSESHSIEKMRATAFFLDEDHAWVTYLFFGRDGQFTDRTSPIWRTFNGGRSWDYSVLPPTELVWPIWGVGLLHFADKHNGWVLVIHDAAMHKVGVTLYNSRNGGADWSCVLGPTPWISGERHVVFVDSLTGMRAIKCGAADAPSIAWTHDGGRTWAGSRLDPPSDAPYLFRNVRCVPKPAWTSRETTILAVDCRDVPTRFCERVPANSYLYSTADDGKTWETRRYPGGEPLFLDRDVGWVAVGRYLFNTKDGGNSWSWVATVNWEGQFSFVSEQAGWAVARRRPHYADTETIILMHTTDGGHTWSRIEPVIGQ